MNNKQLILASNNKNKLREIRQILEPFGFTIISQAAAGADIEVEETGSTYKENAELKAAAVFNICKKPVIADDSGLEIDFLNGEPGVYSARYGGEGTNIDKCNLVLNKMGYTIKRSAHFICAICYIDGDGCIQHVTGECYGTISFGISCGDGFGYDPIFMFGDRAFSEMTHDEKNIVSHRGNALRKLIKIIE